MRNPRSLVKFFLSTVTLISVTGAQAVPAEGQKMMVAGPSPLSADIVRDISSKGGNVIDATVAVGLALAVTTPYYAGLGGGGFALVKVKDKPVEVIDFREVAPKASTPTMYSEDKSKSSVDGGLAVGVPGVPAGLWDLHKKYGKLPWKTLVQPALKLAREGFLVSGEWVENTSENYERFSAGGKAVFFKNGKPLVPGDRLKQPKLAKALELLAAKGAKGFYEGAVAADIAKSVQASGGIITTEDMKNYKTRWLKPIQTQFLGFTIHLMPPPSSGGVVIKSALALTEKLKVTEKPPLSIDELHGLSEVLKMSFRGRDQLGDPDFAKNPIAQLTSEQYLQTLASQFKWNRASMLEPIKESDPLLAQPEESAETTHFSILDQTGNSVALTVTLNGDYGSGVVSSDFGIALNNEMDDFTTNPGQPNMFGLIQGKANEVAPGKRPLSSMSPTLVEKDGQIVMSLGSPGGPRIISSVFQVLYRVLSSKFDIDQAIQAPRVHHQFQPPMVFTDAKKLSPDVILALRARGHKVEEIRNVAKVYGVRKNEKGWLEAAFDSRGEGGAGGH